MSDDGMITQVGKIIHAWPPNQVTEKFKKQEFILSFKNKYDQEVKMELTQDNCEQLKKEMVGKMVEVKYLTCGRSYTKKGTTEIAWFYSNQAISVKELLAAPAAPAPTEKPDDLPW
jgi:hypothetical protein